MSIVPLPIFERDADPSYRDALTDAEVLARLRPPTSIVVRYGSAGWIAEFPYEGSARPGCGSKLVARTPRGVELVEMLTTTCGNSGCGKSVSRQELLQYVDRSGGRDFPFTREGRVLRVATVEDVGRWEGIRAAFRRHTREVKGRVAELGLPMRVVEVEPILGGETVAVHYTSEDRVDYRELVQELAGLFAARIDMIQVGARDEARLTADYERCGQHCCCKTFLKVLRPVSMKSAKVQKATLDPLKISGRCGRLMCCLRYEDQTYEELAKRLPRNKTRVGTPEGPGLVVDSKVLVQLVLVRLEADGREIAVPVEELTPPGEAPPPAPAPPAGAAPAGRVRTPTARPPREPRRSAPGAGSPPAGRSPPPPPPPAPPPELAAPDAAAPDSSASPPEQPARKRRRRRRRRGGDDQQSGGPPSPHQPPPAP